MSRTRILWLLALLLAIAILLLIRDRGATQTGAIPRQDATARGAPADGVAVPIPTGKAPDNDAALRDALATLRAYVALLPADPGKADTYWVDGRPSNDAREADLRALTVPPQRFKLISRAAEAFSGSPRDGEVEIPVELQLSYRDGPARLYRGQYRLRAKQGGGWEIAGAAIDAVPARQ